MTKYIHGYNQKEATRLEDQSNALTSLLHHDSFWEEKTTILEAGCGVGAQTKIIARQNPNSLFTSIDLSQESLEIAEKTIRLMDINNVSFQKADIYKLPFENNSFDHVFVCFVLEHLTEYKKAIDEFKRVLKKNGTLTLIEGDHGSAYYYPESEDAQAAIICQVELQKRHGGNANIGRQLFPIFQENGFSNITVSPRMVYVDGSKPALIEGFTKNTFTAMIEGVRNEVINNGLIEPLRFDKGISDLYRTAQDDGVFCYTFFKGIGMK